MDLAVSYQQNSLGWSFIAEGAELEGGGSISGSISPSAMMIRVPDVANINTSPAPPHITGYSGAGSFFILPSNGVINLPGGVDQEVAYLGWDRGAGIVIDDWSPGDWSSQNGITIELLHASMPDGGHFSSWVGNRYILSTNSPSSTQNSNKFLLPDHDHFNWGFTEAGIYDLTFQASGTHINDGFQSATATFRFLVGSSTAVPEPTSMALLFSGLGCTFVVRKYLKKKASGAT